MAVIQARAIQALPVLEWRGESAPCDSAPVDFGHVQAPRAYYGVDAEGHDNTRRKAHVCRVRLYFINGVEGDQAAFPDNWNAWRRALFDGSSGDLNHPLLGTFRARVLDGSIAFVAQTTAGVVVDVTFTETVDKIDQPNQFVDPKPSLQTTALAAQTAAEMFNVTWQPSTLGTTLFGAVDALTSAAFDAQVTLSGYANQVAGGILGMVAQIEAIDDPASYPAYDNLVRLWEDVTLLAEQTERELGRTTAVRIMQSETTLDAVAADTGNTVEDLMNLNPALLKIPSVPKDSKVTYYTGK